MPASPAADRFTDLFGPGRSTGNSHRVITDITGPDTFTEALAFLRENPQTDEAPVIADKLTDWLAGRFALTAAHTNAESIAAALDLGTDTWLARPHASSFVEDYAAASMPAKDKLVEPGLEYIIDSIAIGFASRAFHRPDLFHKLLTPELLKAVKEAGKSTGPFAELDRGNGKKLMTLTRCQSTIAAALRTHDYATAQATIAATAVAATQLTP